MILDAAAQKIQAAKPSSNQTDCERDRERETDGQTERDARARTHGGPTYELGNSTGIEFPRQQPLCADASKGSPQMSLYNWLACLRPSTGLLKS